MLPQGAIVREHPLMNRRSTLTLTLSERLREDLLNIIRKDVLTWHYTIKRLLKISM